MSFEVVVRYRGRRHNMGRRARRRKVFTISTIILFPGPFNIDIIRADFAGFPAHAQDAIECQNDISIGEIQNNIICTRY